MTTPLFLKSWEMSNSVYHHILRYPFQASMNMKTEQFVLENNKKNLSLLLISNVNLTMFMVLYGALLVKALVFDTIKTQIHQFIVNIFTTCIFAFCLALIATTFLYINELVCEYYNTLMRFEKRIKRIDFETYTHLHNSLPSLFQNEWIKFLKGTHLDVPGLQSVALTIILIITGIGLAPTGILTLINLTSQLANEYCENGCSSESKYLGLFLGYLLTQWCTLEATRAYMTILVPTLTLCNIVLLILNIIRRRDLNSKTLLLYNELYCINQIAVGSIPKVAGVLMSFGLILFVFGNWMIVSVWNTIPREIYLINVGVLVVAYFVLFQTIPIAIRVNDVSTELIQKWKIVSQQGPRRASFWMRKVGALQSVAFYYAMTKFDKNTKGNYYSTIVDNTITALMVF